MWRGIIRCGLVLALLVPLLTPAAAQEFPSRPITIMVGLAPGGITDVTARQYAAAVSKITGKNVVVENRQGAGGALAASAVQKARPDGYTVLIFSGSQHATVPALQKVPYTPLDFTPVTLLFDITTLLVVPEASPAKTVAELLAMGKKKPGGLSFGSPGVGTPSHLQAALIADLTHTPMQYVHYRGGGAMAPDLIAGRVDFALSSYTASGSQIAAGKLRVLAIDAPKRWSKMPDVPTFAEVGLGRATVATWFALAAPPRTPPNIAQRLHDLFVQASRDPALVKRLADNGTPIHTTSMAQAKQLLAQEVDNIDKLVKRLGLKQ